MLVFMFLLLPHRHHLRDAAGRVSLKNFTLKQLEEWCEAIGGCAVLSLSHMSNLHISMLLVMRPCHGLLGQLLEDSVPALHLPGVGTHSLSNDPRTCACLCRRGPQASHADLALDVRRWGGVHAEQSRAGQHKGTQQVS